MAASDLSSARRREEELRLAWEQAKDRERQAHAQRSVVEHDYLVARMVRRVEEERAAT